MDNNNMNNNREQMLQDYVYQQYAPQREPDDKKVNFFTNIFIPTLIYALIYTFCLYDNFSGILVPVFSIATVVYSLYAMNKLNVKGKKATLLYAAAIILLGVASCITDNSVIITFNTLGIIFFIVNMLLHNFYNDGAWGLLKYVGSWFLAIFGALGCVVDPFGDIKAYQNQCKEGKKGNHIYIIIGILVAVPLLAVIVFLLSSADAVFASVIENIFKDIDALTVCGVICMFIFAFFSAYCGLRFVDKHFITEENVKHKKMNSIIAITVSSFISFVYVIFSGIQVVYVFIGGMKLPEGYTYSAYVHEGFNQLLFVCILNLAIVLIGIAFFEENKVLKGLLTIISLCTYIMIASSAYRMCMYVAAYGLTGLRIAVYWGLFVLAILFVGVIIFTFNSNFKLYNYGLVVIGICYLGLAFAKPDYIIADFNLRVLPTISKAETDYNYLSNLSADAAPAFVDQNGAWVEKYAFRMIDKTDFSLREYNFSKAKAKKLFASYISEKEGSVCVRISIDEYAKKYIDATSIRLLMDDKEIEKEKLQSSEDEILFFVKAEGEAKEKYRYCQLYFEKTNGEEDSTDRVSVYTYENKAVNITLTSSENGLDSDFYIYESSYSD